MTARAGQDVVVVESSDDAVRSAVERLERSLDPAADKGKSQSVDAVMQHIDVVTDLSALADRELAVEAIVEDEPATTRASCSGQSIGRVRWPWPTSSAWTPSRRSPSGSMRDQEGLYAPPPLLARIVDARLLGRKAGRGFYTYN